MVDLQKELNSLLLCIGFHLSHPVIYGYNYILYKMDNYEVSSFTHEDMVYVFNDEYDGGEFNKKEAIEYLVNRYSIELRKSKIMMIKEKMNG